MLECAWFVVYLDVADFRRMSSHAPGVGGGSAAAGSAGVRVKRLDIPMVPITQHLKIHSVHNIDAKLFCYFRTFFTLVRFILEEFDFFDETLMHGCLTSVDVRGHGSSHAQSTGC